MVIRALKLLTALLVLSIVANAPTFACFGPKLFVGVGSGVHNEVLYALVTLYVEEKTGVESTRIDIPDGQDPLELLSGQKADLVLILTDELLDNTVLRVDDGLQLVTGDRPVADLQFTTVLPAIRKLDRLLEKSDLAGLVERVNAGESAMAAVREFYMERRWI